MDEFTEKQTDQLEDNLHHAELKITSFTYSRAMNAEHYYGKIFFYDNKNNIIDEFELKHKITKKEAVYLDRKEQSGGLLERKFDKDGFVETVKFSSEEDVILSAYQFCSKIADKIDLGFNLYIQI